jgi:hypothetical protein
MTATVSLTTLQEALDTALDELAEDTRGYLEALERARVAPGGSEEKEDAEVALDTAVTVLMAHSTSANALLNELDDRRVS